MSDDLRRASDALEAAMGVARRHVFAAALPGLRREAEAAITAVRGA